MAFADETGDLVVVTSPSSFEAVPTSPEWAAQGNPGLVDSDSSLQLQLRGRGRWKKGFSSFNQQQRQEPQDPPAETGQGPTSGRLEAESLLERSFRSSAAADSRQDSPSKGFIKETKRVPRGPALLLCIAATLLATLMLSSQLKMQVGPHPPCELRRLEVANS